MRIAVQILFDVSSPTLTSHRGLSNIPGTAIEGVIIDVSTISQQVYPEEGRATIGQLTVRLIDAGSPSTMTDELREQLNYNAGSRNREIRIWVGFTNDFTDFERVGTFFVDNISYLDGIYTITARDLSKSLRQDIFTRKKTQIATAASATDTTIAVASTTGFQRVRHGASFTDAPNTTVGYFLVPDTGEIVRYTGISGNSFTGCVRGVFRTKAKPILFDVAEAQGDRPAIEEFIYLELPAPAMAIAVMTGILDLNISPRPMLPDHWHLGMDWDASFDQTTWTAIGEDLWQPTLLTDGLPVRFTHLETTDGKQFVEKEIFALAGLFAPVNVTGQLTLRRVNRILVASAFDVLITERNTVSHGELRYDQAAVTNQYQIDYNYDGEDLTRSVFFQDNESISIHGPAPVRVFEFKGLHSAAHSQRLVSERIGMLRDRYASPPMRLSVNATPDMNGIELGDLAMVDFTDLQDWADTDNAAGHLHRSFEVQRTAINWSNGDVQLEMVASSRAPADIGQNPTATAPLADSYYTSIGTNIATWPEVTAGVFTGAKAITGTGNLNDSGSIFYFAGNLTINGVLTLNNQAQLRVRGFLQINGSITGADRGPFGATDTDTVNATSTAWTRLGTAGAIGPTRAGDGLYWFKPTDPVDYVANIAGRTTPGRGPTLPRLNLIVSAAGTLPATLPAVLHGTTGGSGAQVVERASMGASPNVYPTPGAGGLVRAKGGIGGRGGSGLLIICRGMGFGASGYINLSGGAGAPGGNTYAANVSLDLPTNGDTLIDFPLRAGYGAGGAPGGLYILLDGDGLLYPDLGAGAFIANYGTTGLYGAETYHAIGTRVVGEPGTISALRYPVNVWDKIAGAEGRGVDQNPVRFAAGQDAQQIPAVNYWVAASQIQYLMAPNIPVDVLRPPVNVTTATGLGFVRVTWIRPPNRGSSTYEVFAATVNDRAFAEEIGETPDNSLQHWMPHGGLRYYWVRARIGDRLSDFAPLSATAGVSGTAQDAGLDIVMTADGGRIWNGDASLTPISWNPQTTYMDLHCQVLEFGVIIAHETVRVTLDPVTGYLTWTSILHHANIAVTATPTPQNSVTFRFTHTPSGLFADDTITAVQSGLPGEAGPPGPSGGRVIGVLKNRSTFTAGSSFHLYVHGFDDLGNAADVNTELAFNGAIIAVVRGSIRVVQAVQENAYIIFDTALSAPFAHGGTQMNMAGARKTRQGWRYDNGTGWTTFTATNAMTVIGSYAKTNIVQSASMYGTAIPLASVPVETPELVFPGDLQPGAIDALDAFGPGFRPVAVVDALPTLPSASYPAGALVYLTSNRKVYRTNYAPAIPVWEYQVDGGDIIAGTIQAAGLAATLVLASIITTAAGTGRRTIIDNTSVPWWIGTGAKTRANAALQYDVATGELLIRGLIEASQIVSGNIVGSRLDVAVIAADDNQPLAIETDHGTLAQLTYNRRIYSTNELFLTNAYQVLFNNLALRSPAAAGLYIENRLQIYQQPFRLIMRFTVYNTSGVSRYLTGWLKYRYIPLAGGNPAWSSYGIFLSRTLKSGGTQLMGFEASFRGRGQFAGADWQSLELSIEMADEAGTIYLTGWEAEIAVLNVGDWDAPGPVLP